MPDRVIELSEAELRRGHGRKWAEYPRDVYPAWIADMDFMTAGPVRRALGEMVERGDFTYSVRPDRVASAFADRTRARFGWVTRADDVVVVADIVQAVTASLMAFSRPRDRVLITSPSYPPLASVIRATGRVMLDVPLERGDGGWVLPLDRIRGEIETGRVAVVLLCNPHNPTGRAFTRDELEGLAELVAGTDVVVVSDEIHADLTYGGIEHIPFATVDARTADRTVTLYSATKAFNLGGLRCGVMHLGPGLRRGFAQAHPDRLLGRVNSPGAEATIVAWQHGQEWLDDVSALLTRNRERVAEWAQSTPGISMSPPQATYFAWLDCSGLSISGEPFDFFLRKARVALSPGSGFGPAYSRYARLNFATSGIILETILDRLAAAAARSLPSEKARHESSAVLRDELFRFVNAPLYVRTHEMGRQLAVSLRHGGHDLPVLADGELIAVMLVQNHVQGGIRGGKVLSQDKLMHGADKRIRGRLRRCPVESHLQPGREGQAGRPVLFVLLYQGAQFG